MPKLKKPSSVEIEENNLQSEEIFYFEHNASRLQETKDTFHNIVANGSVPYLTTFGKLRDMGYILNDTDDEYSYDLINRYIDTLIRNIESPPHGKGDDIFEKEDNWTFHCCKVMWLMHQERTIGLYSTMQGQLSKRKLFVHPGMSRVFAIMQLDLWDKPVVVWDRENVITDQKSLSFDEWYNIFDVPDKSKFAVNVEGRIMEMHVGERRDLIIDAEVDIKTDLFKHKRPIIKGQVSTDIKHHFRESGDDGVLLETHNDYVFTFEDLRWFTELYPETQNIYEADNFTISRL
jgi:hypothetical protein